MKKLLDTLRLPDLETVDIDSGDRIEAHARILAKKPLLQDAFADIHSLFDHLDRTYFHGEGIRLELGAGIAPMRDSFPDVLATDIVASPGLDRVLNAEEMDLTAQSVRSVFGQNCFHHFPHPEKFFHELERVLIPGGGAILLEPYYGPFASFLYKRLFNTEGFEKDSPSWETPEAAAMTGANQALSYVVFVRDRDIFKAKFPALEIVHEAPVRNYLKYLLSGGLNFRQLWPDWAKPILKAAQWTLTPFDKGLALHHVVVLRKSAT